MPQSTPLANSCATSKRRGLQVLKTTNLSKGVQHALRKKPSADRNSLTVASASGQIPKGVLRRKCKNARPKLMTRSSTRKLTGRVSFAETVNVCGYARWLAGGGGVPGDGTWITLGLGRLMQTLQEPLKSERGGTGKLDEDVPWMASARRARVLRAAMGDTTYKREWVAQRKEMRQLSRLRQESNLVADDFEPMPSSAEEARARAIAVSKEVALMSLSAFSLANDNHANQTTTSQPGDQADTNCEVVRARPIFRRPAVCDGGPCVEQVD